MGTIVIPIIIIVIVCVVIYGLFTIAPIIYDFFVELFKKN